MNVHKYFEHTRKVHLNVMSRASILLKIADVSQNECECLLGSKGLKFLNSRTSSTDVVHFT
jgi:hypothetical protein